MIDDTANDTPRVPGPAVVRARAVEAPRPSSLELTAVLGLLLLLVVLL